MSEIWPVAFERGAEIRFGHIPFQWSNLASHNAGVTVTIIGLGEKSGVVKRLFDDGLVRECSIIGPYLVPNRVEVVTKANEPIGQQARMFFGNMPRDGGYLFLSSDEAAELMADPETRGFVKRFVGSEKLINGKLRYCLWIEDRDVDKANGNVFISNRSRMVSESRNKSPAKSTRDFAAKPHRFVQIGGVSKKFEILVAGVSSENRQYLPCDLTDSDKVASNKNVAHL